MVWGVVAFPVPPVAERLVASLIWPHVKDCETC